MKFDFFKLKIADDLRNVCFGFSVFCVNRGIEEHIKKLSYDFLVFLYNIW